MDLRGPERGLLAALIERNEAHPAEAKNYAFQKPETRDVSPRLDEQTIPRKKRRRSALFKDL
jgi:hypothetical protein